MRYRFSLPANIIFICFILLIILLGCQNHVGESKDLHLQPAIDSPKIDRDLRAIRESGVLKAITVYSGTSYFLHKGKPMGFEYELLERLARHLGVELEIVIAEDINQLISMLNQGEGDIIAHGLAITQDRKSYVDFTDYLYLTRQVLVQRKPAQWRKMKLHEIQKNLVSDPIELIGDTVSLRINTSYYRRLKNLEEEIGGNIYVDTLPGEISTDKIIYDIVQEKIDYTFADDNIAKINASYFPILDINTQVSFSQRIGWAVRKNSPALLDTVNLWIQDVKRQVDYYAIYQKYFESPRRFRQLVKNEFYDSDESNISPYDDLIKEQAEYIGWDWKFITSIVYQESRFNEKAQSWTRAQGLMQLMPATARELGVQNLSDPEDNIKGGITYLNKLWKQWNTIPDSIQRLKFTIASYNCGINHIRDAQELTKKYNGNPLEWDEEVETYLRKLTFPKYYQDEVVKYGYVRGIEPVNYVNQIFNRYQHYEQILQAQKQQQTIDT